MTLVTRHRGASAAVPVPGRSRSVAFSSRWPEGAGSAPPPAAPRGLRQGTVPARSPFARGTSRRDVSFTLVTGRGPNRRTECGGSPAPKPPGQPPFTATGADVGRSESGHSWPRARSVDDLPGTAARSRRSSGYRTASVMTSSQLSLARAPPPHCTPRTEPSTTHRQMSGRTQAPSPPRHRRCTFLLTLTPTGVAPAPAPPGPLRRPQQPSASHFFPCPLCLPRWFAMPAAPARPPTSRPRPQDSGRP